MAKEIVGEETAASLKEIAMLLAVLVKRGGMQSTVIKELGAVGFSPKRIAELVGTTPNTVSVALYEARHQKPKRRKK
jgi:CRP-like cAMP-binding protein